VATARPARSLLREIERGKFKVGDLLPTELELCKRFGVSRYTAREAVRRLKDAGMVSRRAGIGTTVTASASPSRYTASVSDLTELFAFTRKARLQVLSDERVAIHGDLATMLPGAIGQQWHRIDGVRHVSGVADPIVHVSILLRPGYEAVRDHLRDAGAMIYELIEQLYGERVLELRQEITCLRCPKAIAVLLGTKTGSPALRVLRYYLGAGDTLLSLAISTYPEDRFKLVTRWRLDAQAGAS
jgi:DNA-binding GntR family transcriptional regulator